jgi:hypothetical protein
MGGVDLQDQVTALFPVMRRTVKAYRKIFFYLLDVCIFNSFTVYHKVTGKKKTHFTDFKKKHWTAVAEKCDITGLLYSGTTFSPANANETAGQNLGSLYRA